MTDEEQKERYYSVLNLPISASQNEIRERYRALSVVFHPDKQHDERYKDTAAKTFLEIQEAYAVLSDPFLREVYDILGEKATRQEWPPSVRSMKPEEIRAHLQNERVNLLRQEAERLVYPKGSITSGVNLYPLFAPYKFDKYSSFSQRLQHRIFSIEVYRFGIRHSIKKTLSDKTSVTLIGRLSRGPAAADKIDRGNIFGAIRHQFSPRVTFEGNASFLRPHVLTGTITYGDDDNACSIQSTFVPAAWRNMFPPPTTISISRRLFSDSSTEGVVTWAMNPLGLDTLSFAVLSPQPFDITSSDDYVSPRMRGLAPKDQPGSLSGFGIGTFFWSYGLDLRGIQSCLKTELGVSFTELALQIKTSVELGLEAFAYVLSGSWSNKDSGISVGISAGSTGLSLRIELMYLHQKYRIPIVLSPNHDFSTTLSALIIPSTAFVLGYHFILKPRRRAQRLEYFRDARRILLEEKSEARREMDNVIALLTETAKRHMQTERSKGGLVIVEAKYGPTSADSEAEDLMLDVTVPMQALVHNSQVYIPGHRTKAGIQGFIDPAPASPKVLHVRYLFRDRMHYAEIPDYIPVVLPLKGHLVDPKKS